MLLRISENENHPSSLEERFFKALKEATITGYYTSEFGIHNDLHDAGNTFTSTNFRGAIIPSTE